MGSENSPKDFQETELQESLMNGMKLDLPDLPSHFQVVELVVKFLKKSAIFLLFLNVFIVTAELMR